MRAVLSVGWGMLVLLLTGCEFSEGEDFDDDAETRFENASSVAVTVTAAGDEDFSVFLLQTDTRRFVPRNGEEMSYTFSPADRVQVVENGNFSVTFLDP